MAWYVVRVQKNTHAKFVTLPVALCRGLGLNIGDTMLIEPQADGTLMVVPPKLMPRMLDLMREKIAQEGNHNGE